jgi:methylated-DNA-protein-cysteine methyltransferase-like protein
LATCYQFQGRDIPKVSDFIIKDVEKSLNEGRGHPSGAANQANVLRGEGVTVTRGNLGEYLVDLSEYGWFPRQLPSHAAEGIAPFDDSEEE